MEDNNIKWEIGDIAICKKVGPFYDDDDASAPPVRLNVEYIVHSVRICECGEAALDVGLYTPREGGTICTCGSVSMPGTHIHWACASRFVKKRTNKAIESEIEEAVASENFELAEKLSKQLKKQL